MATVHKSYLQELQENPELLAVNNALDAFFEQDKIELQADNHLYR